MKQLGSGQHGQVYLALDTLLDRHVAVKFLSDARPGAAARQRLLLEARAAARIHHPNVVTIYRGFVQSSAWSRAGLSGCRA